MTTTPQQRLEEIAAQEKQLAEESKVAGGIKDDDLETVKKLCKQHGFAATQLRGCLATKGKKKPGSDAAAKKPAAKKAPAKKAAKAK